jgi:hypothetical protein
LVGSVGGASLAYSDVTVSPTTTYSYTVKARDAAGNVSAASKALSVTTPNVNTMIFAPTDDAYVQQNVPNNNYGAATTLAVDNSPVDNMLLKFTISGLNGRSVTSAKLRLCTTNSSVKGGDFHLTATNTWSEGSVTWSNAPAAQAATIASLGSVSNKSCYQADLSSVVSGAGILSLRASSTSTDAADYASKEATTTANRPQLVLTLGP